VNVRTAKDWDYGVSKTRNSRTYPDGRRVDYTTGMITVGQPLAPVEKVLHERFVSLTEREAMADLRRAGTSIRKIAEALGRAPSTVSRELARNGDTDGEYRPFAAHRAAAGRRARPKTSKLAVSFAAAGLRGREADVAVVPGTDLSRSGRGVPRRSRDAREPRDDLPGALPAGPRRAAPRGGRGVAHRPGPTPTPTRPAGPHLPVRRPDGDDQ
jgi:hypothetical protein